MRCEWSRLFVRDFDRQLSQSYLAKVSDISVREVRELGGDEVTYYVAHVANAELRGKSSAFDVREVSSLQSRFLQATSANTRLLLQFYNVSCRPSQRARESTTSEIKHNIRTKKGQQPYSALGRPFVSTTAKEEKV